ncbi:MAG: arsenic efflux protein [Eubacteriaceae bacterium]|nr:arsenic efflux protein [Eubacteriaceae bacterium]MBR2779929.1 arsenic efflux protein [Eubacteriaceae bacterium]
MFADILIDTLTDLAKLLPLLFVTYLLMEYFEDRFAGKSTGLIVRNRWGIPLAALIGAIPQCGFSASAAELYCGGVLSYATLITVFFSTSDEMLPLMISSAMEPVRMLKILALKIAVAVIAGLVTQLALGKKNTSSIADACRNENCNCEEDGILRSALKHTLNIALFIGAVSLALNLLMGYAGSDAIRNIFSGNPVMSLLVIPLVGLIPNCAASVIITEMFLNGMISSSLLIAGLCANSGVALLVLFRNNKNLRENIFTVFWLYLLSVITGLILGLAGISL